MKRLRYLTIVIVAFIAALSVGCNGDGITVGKYYAERGTDSYIEILENEKILFVNIDFSELEESLNVSGSSLSVAEVAEKLGSPQKYDHYKGSTIDGYDFTLQVLIDKNTPRGELCLTLRWSKENTILCLGAIYSRN